MNNEEIISHHGIKGQRWYIRRFQNPDGSLTAAGRKRAQKLKGEYKALTGKKLKGKITKEEPHKRNITELNATELKSRLERSKNIKSTLDNEADSYTSFKSTLFRRVVAPAAVDAGKNILQNLIEASLSKALGLDGNKFKEVSKESKKEINKITDQVIKEQVKDEEKREKRAAKKAAKEAKKQAKAQERQQEANRDAWERQQKANRDAWERQQEANRDFVREMESRRNARQKYDASDTDRGKSVVKDAVYIEKEPNRLSYREQYLLPYKK